MSELFAFEKGTALEADESLGLVFGWGIVCTEKGEDHFDLQGDHISDVVMLKGVTDFMKHARVAKDMHTGEQIGMIVHSFPLTKHIAEAYGIVTEKTGWLVAFAPDDVEILKMYSDGRRTGFSIGGQCAFEVELLEAA